MYNQNEHIALCSLNLNITLFLLYKKSVPDLGQCHRGPTLCLIVKGPHIRENCHRLIKMHGWYDTYIVHDIHTTACFIVYSEYVI